MPTYRNLSFSPKSAINFECRKVKLLNFPPYYCPPEMFFEDRAPSWTIPLRRVQAETYPTDLSLETDEIYVAEIVVWLKREGVCPTVPN